MAPIIFDGRSFGKKIEDDLRIKIQDLRSRRITPKLVTILVGDDPASVLYVNLKKKAAERIGANLEIMKFPTSILANQLIELIKKLNSNKSVHGIMVQLPIPGDLRHKTKDIIQTIAKEKDVDGLREDSSYVPATVRAVSSILDYADSLTIKLFNSESRFCVVGSSGMVGKPLVKLLRERSYEVAECDIDTKNLRLKTKEADVLISATGVPGLIKGNIVKQGAIIIDVGSPKGDANFEEVSKKASFITPVPGGVGPVTIVSLLENLVDAASK